jgi:hypothetical protein
METTQTQIHFTNFKTSDPTGLNFDLNAKHAIMPLALWLQLVSTLSDEQRYMLRTSDHAIHAVSASLTTC